MGSELYYYYQDEQLSTALLTDAAGRVRNYYRYDAFGGMLAGEEGVSNRIRYTGQQYDEISEQYYLRARYYNPVVGRFLQEDVYEGDGLNLYAYCGNNPVRYYDPSGYASTGNSGYEEGLIRSENENEDDPIDNVTQPDYIVGPNGTIVSEQVYNMSNADFIQEVANISNASVNEKLTAEGKSTYGHVAGSKKHSKAESIVIDYQNDIKDRGLETEISYERGIQVKHNKKGNSRLDVRDSATNDVYDYKFVLKPGKGLSTKQARNIMRNAPGGITQNQIHEVNPK